MGYQIVLTEQNDMSLRAVIEKPSITTKYAYSLSDAVNKTKEILIKLYPNEQVEVKAFQGSVDDRKRIYISEFGSATSLFAKYIICQVKFKSEYKYYGGSKKKIYIGKRGGEYYIKNGKKIYV